VLYGYLNQMFSQIISAVKASRCSLDVACRLAVVSAENHMRQRRKRQTRKVAKVLTAILTLPNLT